MRQDRIGRRAFQMNEIMTGSLDIISSFKMTLALLEDSFWYQANYSIVDSLDWVCNQGTYFVTAFWNLWKGAAHCSTTHLMGCTYNQEAEGYCPIVNYSADVPRWYFSQDNKEVGNLLNCSVPQDVIIYKARARLNQVASNSLMARVETHKSMDSFCPVARTILINGVVRIGARLMPPLALDLSSARVKVSIICIELRAEYHIELLVVDEATAIPLPVVKSLLGPYLVFLSSTANGVLRSDESDVWEEVDGSAEWENEENDNLVGDMNNMVMDGVESDEESCSTAESTGTRPNITTGIAAPRNTTNPGQENKQKYLHQNASKQPLEVNLVYATFSVQSFPQLKFAKEIVTMERPGSMSVSSRSLGNSLKAHPYSHRQYTIVDRFERSTIVADRRHRMLKLLYDAPVAEKPSFAVGTVWLLAVHVNTSAAPSFCLFCAVAPNKSPRRDNRSKRKLKNRRSSIALHSALMLMHCKPLGLFN
ncbi:leishmanolysin-like peptidase [Tanacetum coccineum]